MISGEHQNDNVQKLPHVLSILALFVRPTWACFIMCVASVLGAIPVIAVGGVTPGFDCSKVHSEVLKTICGSPRLAELDAELNDIYTSMRGQPAFIAPAFEQEESDWLRRVRDRCTDADCLDRAYTERIAVLTERSRRAASPAAYHETRPFPAPEAVLAEARSYIGKPCNEGWDGTRGFVLPGFHRVDGFLGSMTKATARFVREKNETRFLFLVKLTTGTCRFTDVAVLPSAARANELVDCYFGEAPDISTGQGIRKVGTNSPLAYWEVDETEGRLVRQPLGVLGVEEKIQCQAVEGDY